MPITNKQIDKHKHLGAYGVFFLPTQVLCQTPELHVQGGKDQVREGCDWPTRLWLMVLPCQGVSNFLKQIPPEG